VTLNRCLTKSYQYRVYM